MAARTSKRRAHSPAQWLLLAVSVLVILACFAASAALLWGKHEREQFQALEAIPSQSTVPGTQSADDPSGTGAAPVSLGNDGGQPVDSVPQESFPASSNAEAKNYLIAAADNHACVDPNSPWANAADPGRPANDRSDTIMVIRVDPQTRAAAVLSFPRDLYINRPGGGKSRINEMYRRNDHTRLVATLQQNFKVPVDHYVQIDFCAFKTIVDAVGGVSVPFSTAIRDPNVGIDIPEAGKCHEFSGDEALAYVRSRHLEQFVNGKWVEDQSSDFGRISRQQDFLTRTMRSALSKGTFNPSVARGLLRTFQNGDLITDQGFSIDEILGLAGLLRDIHPESLLRYQIEGSGAMIQGKAVVIPKIDTKRMKAVLSIFRGEAPLTGAGVPETPATDPSTATSATTSGSSTATTASPSTSPAPSTPPTAEHPEQIIKGDIMPDPTVTCA